MTKNNFKKQALAFSVMTISLMLISNINVVYADHNEETAQYTRTTSAIDIINNEGGIQVAYWYPEGNSLLSNPTLEDFNNDLGDWINAFKLNPWFIAAYAEEATVQIPFDYNGQSTTFFEFDTYYQYLVKFTGDKDKQPSIVERDPDSEYLPECTDINLVYDAELDRCITEEQLELEAINNYVAPTTPTPELTRTEQTIIRYEQGEITQLEKEIISLLEKQRSVCLVDILTIQTYGELQIPIEQFLDPETGELSIQLVRNYIEHAFNQKNHPVVSKLIRDIEACRGQSALKDITGPRYDSMIVEDEYTKQFIHQDSAIGMDTYPVPRLVEESFQTTQDTANNAICESDYYAENLKRSYGCYPDVSLQTNAVINYQSDAMSAYEEYLQDGDSEQLEKLQRESLQQKLWELYN